MRWGQLTELDAPPAKPEAREHHLPQAEAGAKGRKIAHGHDAEQVEEEDDEDGVDEAEIEEGFAEDADGEGGDDHVG